MGWIPEFFSDDTSPDGRATGQDPVGRARQLRRGVGRAAAALEDEHPELARSADEAAERLVGRLPDDADAELARDAVGRLGRLHFDLLRVDVSGMAPEDVGVDEDVVAVRELADRAPGRPEAGPGSGDGSAPSGGRAGRTPGS